MATTEMEPGSVAAVYHCRQPDDQRRLYGNQEHADQLQDDKWNHSLLDVRQGDLRRSNAFEVKQRQNPPVGLKTTFAG